MLFWPSPAHPSPKAGRSLFKMTVPTMLRHRGLSR
jgi:hypothetical protein